MAVCCCRFSPLLVLLFLEFESSGREYRIIHGGERVLQRVKWCTGYNVVVFHGIIALLPLHLYIFQFFGVVFQIMHAHFGEVTIDESAPPAMSRPMAKTSPRVYPPTIVQVQVVSPHILEIPLADSTVSLSPESVRRWQAHVVLFCVG